MYSIIKCHNFQTSLRANDISLKVNILRFMYIDASTFKLCEQNDASEFMHDLVLV